MTPLLEELAGHRHWLDAEHGTTRYLTDFRDDWRTRLTRVSYAYDYADFSVTDRPHRRKYVNPTGSPTQPVTPDQHAAGIDVTTSGEKARIYLRQALQLADRKWIGYRRDARVYLNVTDDIHDLKQPAYYRGGQIDGRYCLIDIDRAYWQIAASGTADMHLRLKPGGGITVGQGVIEWPRPEDVGEQRNLAQAVIGLLHMTHGTHVVYGQPRTHPVANTYLAPDLYAYILFTLQAVAYEAVEQWAVPHVCVDSYAVLENRADDFVRWLWDRWTLTATIRARGNAHYYGYCVYEYLATRYGDQDTATAWVTQARATTGRPPRPYGPTGNLVGRHTETRNQLADARRWLTGTRTLTSRNTNWTPLPQHRPQLEWRPALT